MIPDYVLRLHPPERRRSNFEEGQVSASAALEFEILYSVRSGISVEELRTMGRVIAPCDCPEMGYPHWQSLPRDAMEDYKTLGRVPKDWVWPPV